MSWSQGEVNWEVHQRHIQGHHWTISSANARCCWGTWQVWRQSVSRLQSLEQMCSKLLKGKMSSKMGRPYWKWSHCWVLPARKWPHIPSHWDQPFRLSDLLVYRTRKSWVANEFRSVLYQAYRLICISTKGTNKNLNPCFIYTITFFR